MADHYFKVWLCQSVSHCPAGEKSPVATPKHSQLVTGSVTKEDTGKSVRRRESLQPGLLWISGSALP